MSLQTCLADQRQTLLDFEQLLAEENTLLLRSFEPQELAQITLRKYQLVERIEQQDQARAQLLQERELENNIQGLRYAAEEDELEHELDQLIELSEKVRNASDNNRILVDTFLVDTQQNLDALEAFTGRNTFYDASGKTQNTQSSLSLKV
ncbi:flagellar protein FlgN [Alcaligenes nematophilus]|jgi:flagellar biosynthesis/type III secretory pathway chaperone|uniref:Flagellar protein FlgN n=3 Tax=Alcaligenes TaxID=507 RepID=A0AAE9H8R5_ALCFA|nr:MULTISPECIES: flagellar export chaperone FlgN [Alcaligenes]MDH4867135.1 flagellar export chaperone FlgN [Bacillus cereus]ASC91278.1 flagellar synthesis chaperone [Alcaligenes faecalis]KVX05332.1 flagellar synthesis chaperone [Alcaligenes faecalis]MCM2558102.1 flagellar protein FlgN [Alcaligenes faecalis]MCM2621038.1 flagellar protein FlgN [Alcaligenes faecalis]